MSRGTKGLYLGPCPDNHCVPGKLCQTPEQFAARSAKAKASPWIAHVKAVAKEQGISYKDALKLSKDGGTNYQKKTYCDMCRRQLGESKRSAPARVPAGRARVFVPSEI